MRCMVVLGGCSCGLSSLHFCRLIGRKGDAKLLFRLYIGSSGSWGGVSGKDL